MIILLGVPGVGKSSVLNELKKKLDEEWQIINYGDLMLKIFSEKYGIKDRDEMRKASIEQQKEVQKEAAEILSKAGRKTILDTHCSIQTPAGYLPGLPFSLLKNLDVERLILLSADVEEIYERRLKDESRKRETDKNKIKEHDEMNKAYLAAYSAFSGAPATIVMNHNGKLQEAVERIYNLLRY